MSLRVSSALVRDHVTFKDQSKGEKLVARVLASFRTVSFLISCTLYSAVWMIAAGFCFKMSRIPDNVNLSDRYAVLLDESSKENQLTDRDQHNATKFEDLSNKVGT